MKQKKPGDRLLPPSVRDLVPESQAYSDLLHLERKVDYTIMRKRLEMQESLKRPQKIKKKLRLFITNSYYPANPQQTNSTGNWELRVEGRLLEQESLNRYTSRYNFIVINVILVAITQRQRREKQNENFQHFSSHLLLNLTRICTVRIII